jgi:ribosomal subunit interface protein
MNINIKTTTISLTPSISEYVDKHLDVVKKFLENDPTVVFDLELAKTTNHHKHGDIFKAEIHIIAKDQNIYASVEKEDLYAAIDVVRDEVMRKLKSSKDKRQSLLRRGGAKVKNMVKGLWNRE